MSKPSAHAIITNLLYSMDHIRDRTDVELMEAFMDPESDHVVRDTAQVILEARAFIGSDEVVPTFMAKRYICDIDGSMKLHPYGQWINEVDCDRLRASVASLVEKWRKQSDFYVKRWEKESDYKDLGLARASLDCANELEAAFRAEKQGEVGS